MAHNNLRMRVDDQGRLEVVDPGLDALPLLMAVNSDFCVESAPLEGFTTPRLLQIRDVGTDISADCVALMSEEQLWAAHRDALNEALKRRNLRRVKATTEASILDLKIELAGRVLQNCRLCAHGCGVDRTGGELGVCRLGTEAVVAEHFIHIAELAFRENRHIISLMKVTNVVMIGV